MSYVNFGSNWGGKSANNNLLDIFKKYSVVFSGLDDPNKVKKYLSYNYEIGTKIIVTDGKKNIAVAISTSKFNSLNKLNIHFDKKDKNKFGIDSTVLAVKVKLFELDKYDKKIDFFQAQGNRFCNINNEKDKNYIDKLLKKYSGELAMEELKESYISLLKTNYNLILTGAPGTGKTYLAKQIAAKIIFNDNNKEYTEELEDDENFKNQCQFVQFHPSYDYTDFVEGLRPIKDSDGKIGFERKDGVFKDFCKKALENLIEIESITIKEYLITFANEMYNDFKKDNKITLEGISGKSVAPFTNIEFDEKKEILSMKAESQGEYTISGNIDEYVDWYKLYKKLQQNETSIKGMMEDKIPKFKGKGSYLCAILNNFYEKYNSEIEKEVNNKKKNFVFIIDEINRGEISKIFGELFFAIDPGYRGIKGKVITQYSNLINEESEKYFYIPENVYIIGTMNDIDRSVESMDFAMRRRFAWKEVKAENTQYMLDTMFDDNDEIKEEDKQSFIKEAKERMNNLNKSIEQIESFNSSYHIGASYFLKLKNYYKSSSDNKNEAFDMLWENHLRGLLYEYLRGMPDAESKLEELKNAYNAGSSDDTQSASDNAVQDSDN
uniref:McrB family protein n=1 Tax=Brachyspira catarrhinii TaxID=2528966 RepID=UPI003F4BBCBE